MGYISKNASIDPSCYIGQNVTILGKTRLNENVIVEDNVIIGKPTMHDLNDFASLPQKERTIVDYDNTVKTETVIEAGCILSRGTLIYSGCHLHSSVETEDNIRIGWDSVIGARTRIMYDGMVYCRVKTGSDCRISGYVGNDTVLGNSVSFFGKTVHPYIKYSNKDEFAPAPTISDDTIVGIGAKIIGGLIIGKKCYVAANAVVTKDVPDETVVSLCNHHTPRSSWKGRLEYNE